MSDRNIPWFVAAVVGAGLNVLLATLARAQCQLDWSYQLPAGDLKAAV